MAACQFCGNEFEPVRSAKFCSGACRTAAWHKAHPRAAGLVICVVCGAEFQAERKTAKYCSRACQGKAYRVRYNEWKRRVMMKSGQR